MWRSAYQTLKNKSSSEISWILLFRQRYTHKKERKQQKNVNIFGFSGPWHPRLPETCSLFAQSPLLIDLWIKECQILMIFYYFSWKWRRSPSQDLALDTNKNHFGGRSLQICLNKYKHCWVLIFLWPNILLSCW